MHGKTKSDRNTSSLTKNWSNSTDLQKNDFVRIK